MTSLSPSKPSHLRWIPPAHEHGAWAVLIGSYLGAWALHRRADPSLSLVLRGVLPLVTGWFSVLAVVEALRIRRWTRALALWIPATLATTALSLPDRRATLAIAGAFLLIPAVSLAFRYMTRLSGKRGLWRVAVGVGALEGAECWGAYLFNGAMQGVDIALVAGLLPFFLGSAITVKWLLGGERRGEEAQRMAQREFAWALVANLGVMGVLTWLTVRPWGLPIIYLPAWIFWGLIYLQRLQPKSLMNVGWTLLVLTLWTAGALGWVLGG